MVEENNNKLCRCPGLSEGSRNSPFIEYRGSERLSMNTVWKVGKKEKLYSPSPFLKLRQNYNKRVCVKL